MRNFVYSLQRNLQTQHLQPWHMLSSDLTAQVGTTVAIQNALSKFCTRTFYLCKAVVVFICLLLGLSTNTYALEQVAKQANFSSVSTMTRGSTTSEPSLLLANSEVLQYERDLLQKHEALRKRYYDNYKNIRQTKQPANKTEQCLIHSDLLDGVLNGNTVLIFWEGSCKNGLADGFGRVYVISNGRKTFEMLSNFSADNPDNTTTFYSRNDQLESQTVYFYGRSTRFDSSGIKITKRALDGDLIVSMQHIDKRQLITYQKEISKNSRYILNIMDLGNYSHSIHDLNNTPYRSLFMSYKLTDNSVNRPLGYNFTGFENGAIAGNYTDHHGGSEKVNPPIDVIRHVIELNDEIEVQIENSVKDVVESLPVLDAYLNVICDDKYQNAVCTKMQCKSLCNLNTNLTPDNAEVKSLLLRLVDHHNNRPLRTYLEHSAAYVMQQEQRSINNPTAEPVVPSVAPVPEQSQYRGRRENTIVVPAPDSSPIFDAPPSREELKESAFGRQYDNDSLDYAQDLGVSENPEIVLPEFRHVEPEKKDTGSSRPREVIRRDERYRYGHDYDSDFE